FFFFYDDIDFQVVMEASIIEVARTDGSPFIDQHGLRVKNVGVKLENPNTRSKKPTDHRKGDPAHKTHIGFVRDQYPDVHPRPGRRPEGSDERTLGDEISRGDPDSQSRRPNTMEKPFMILTSQECEVEPNQGIGTSPIFLTNPRRSGSILSIAK